MKSCPRSFRRLALLGAGLACLSTPRAEAEVLYAGLQNVAIPFGLNATGWAGVFLDLDTGATGTAEFSGWDINPFFGGWCVANNQSFQPARVGGSNDQPILALGAGVTVGSGLLPVSGLGSFSGSENHLGNGPRQFHDGQDGYLGFRFTTNGSSAPKYGWMRVTFTENTPGGMINDWAYETNGGAIETGGVIRSAPLAGISAVTLSSGPDVTSTVSSPIANLAGGGITELVKTGSGTTHLGGEHTFTGSTTIAANGGTLGVSGLLSGTTALAVNSGGTLLLSGVGGVDAKLNPTATVALAGGTINLGGLTSSLDQTVGVLTLSADSTFDFGTLAAGHHWTFGAGQASESGLDLRILNYTPGKDHLLFGAGDSGSDAPPGFRISFYSDAGNTFLGFREYDGSSGEFAPVPEPSGMILGVGLLGLACWREQRRARRRVNRVVSHAKR